MAKKSIAKKKVVVKKTTTKSGKTNKSAAIREFFAKNPNAKPKEAVAALAKNGLKVSPQQVSTVRYTAANKKKATPKSPAKAAEKVAVSSLLNAKKFVNEVGGVDAAKSLIDTISQLKD